MSHGPCGRGGVAVCAAGAAVAVANVTPIGKSAIAAPAARVLKRMRRMGDLNMMDKLLCLNGSNGARPRSQLIVRSFGVNGYSLALMDSRRRDCGPSTARSYTWDQAAALASSPHPAATPV